MTRLRHARPSKEAMHQTWGPPGPQQAPAPPTDASPHWSAPDRPVVQPKKRRRIFLWVFLAVQILFLVWIISGSVSASGTSNDCQGLTGDALSLCEDAGDVGTAIGVGLIIALWAAVDIILGISYIVYRLATRPPRI
ncbi:hypothetical protein ACFW9L_16555 [Streptomyces sp. NPDC059517]|uniref:hypothetical protein n=1 Tax=Streptomyces sp. NPDC059517 TaxID=3346855 RepID=UPI003693F9F5